MLLLKGDVNLKLKDKKGFLKQFSIVKCKGYRRRERDLFEFNQSDLNEPLYRLFDFDCELIPDIDIDPQWLRSFNSNHDAETNENSSENINENNNNTISNYQEVNEQFLHEQEPHDFSVIISKLDTNDSSDKDLLYIRNKCNITKGNYFIL